MAHCTGWILDISIEQNRTVIWIKTTEGNILRLVDKYQPNFYMLPKDEFAGEALIQLLLQESIVTKVEWVQKSADIFDAVKSWDKKTNLCLYKIRSCL